MNKNRQVPLASTRLMIPSKTKRVLRWLCVSDVHLGHLRTPTEFILANLERELFDGKIANLDILFIAGDLFERALEYNHPSSGSILLFVDRLITECHKHGVKLRVLEGTPSHDNKQNKVFDDVHALYNFESDMKYVDKLSIEYIEEWDMRILYVPDKIRTTTELVYFDTLSIFKAAGVEKVDLAIMHGAFSHQLPPMAKQVYDPDQWLTLVKHWLLVGHVHKHTINSRIAAQGSFDRLCQGEEAPKGYLMGTLNLHGDPRKDEIYFIENKGAKKYVTVDCSGLTIEDSLSKIESFVLPLPNDSYIRIRAETGNPILSNMSEVSKFNLSNFWDKDEQIADDSKDDEQIETHDELDTWVPIHIDNSNITQVIMERLNSKNHSGQLLQLAKQFIGHAL